jgi:disulfide bond formation protein DsbB
MGHTITQILIYFNSTPEYQLKMKKPCKICQQTRVAFVWVILIIFLANSVYQLANTEDGLSIKDIIIVPLTICMMALLIKLYMSARKSKRK